MQQRLAEKEAELAKERAQCQELSAQHRKLIESMGHMSGGHGAASGSADTKKNPAHIHADSMHVGSVEWGLLLSKHNLQMQIPPKERRMEDVVSDLLQVIAMQQAVLDHSKIKIPQALKSARSVDTGDSTFLTTADETEPGHHESEDRANGTGDCRTIYTIPCKIHGPQGVELEEETSGAGVSDAAGKKESKSRYKKTSKSVNELGGLFKPAGEYLQGRGLGSDVPNFLKMHGHVRNLKLSKREAEKIVFDCWKKKDEMEEKVKKPLPLLDFFFEFMKTTHGTQAAVAEMSYNLLDALNRFSYSTDCLMFLKMIEGHLSEQYRKDELESFKRLFVMLSGT
jgi:hypothetical protein